MSESMRVSRRWLYVTAVALFAALLAVFMLTMNDAGDGKAVGKRRSRIVEDAVVRAPAGQGVRAAPAPAAGFAPQTRLGFTVGDQWEPAIAADRFGNIYMLYPQYLGVPGCAPEVCASSTMVLQISNDRGATWGPPRALAPSGTSQVDAQIVVDPIDGRTLYASWLQNDKSDIAFTTSTDFGATWSTVKAADDVNVATDKPIIAVRGNDVYIAYDHLTGRGVWIAVSHNRGATFAPVKIDPGINFGVALSSSGTVDPSGNIYFSWVGYERHGQAKGPVNAFITKSADGGATWTTKVIDVSAETVDCSAFQCGWAYLSAQIVVASDAAGTLYALWNASTVDRGPARLYFAKSTDAGATWSPKVDLSTAPQGVNHTFPAIVAGAAGDVRIAWMDTRAGSLWNTYYRSSSNGGASWSTEVDLSSYVSGFSYIQPDGFSFPFGDYFELDIDDRGTAHVIWGEGLNWDSPGSIWYSRGR